MSRVRIVPFEGRIDNMRNINRFQADFGKDPIVYISKNTIPFVLPTYIVLDNGTYPKELDNGDWVVLDGIRYVVTSVLPVGGVVIEIPDYVMVLAA